MSLLKVLTEVRRHATVGISFVGLMANMSAPLSAQTHSHSPITPIQHVIVIIGENRSFDHVFATYQPKNGQHVWNLLSQGIVNADGTPGPNFHRYQQSAAVDRAPDPFLLSPPKTAFPHDVLPAPLTGGPKTSYIYPATLANAMASESGLPTDYYQYLLTGGTGQASKVPDARISNVEALPTGPFQLTNGSTFVYDDYAASPVHRFYQMWQQLDCDLSHASYQYPNGCDSLLFPWVEVTEGAGQNGEAQPSNFSINAGTGLVTTGEGSTSVGFYNVQKGDVPYFTSLANDYAMSDNFHQSVNGGTATGIRQCRRTAPRSLLLLTKAIRIRTRAWSMKLRTPIRKPAPTTGGSKTATGTVITLAIHHLIRPNRFRAADRTPTARILASRAWNRS
jgi:phospholipase C